MSDEWTNEVERIAFATFSRGIRIIGVTGARPGSGVTAVCDRLCEMVAGSGAKTLLIDLSGRPEAGPVTAAWLPGEGGGRAIHTSRCTGFRPPHRFVRRQSAVPFQ